MVQWMRMSWRNPPICAVQLQLCCCSLTWLKQSKINQNKITENFPVALLSWAKWTRSCRSYLCRECSSIPGLQHLCWGGWVSRALLWSLFEENPLTLWRKPLEKQWHSLPWPCLDGSVEGDQEDSAAELCGRAWIYKMLRVSPSAAIPSVGNAWLEQPKTDLARQCPRS